MKQNEISSEAGISRRTVARVLSSLKEKGIIEGIGSDRSGYWKILK